MGLPNCEGAWGGEAVWTSKKQMQVPRLAALARDDNQKILFGVEDGFKQEQADRGEDDVVAEEHLDP